MASLRFGIIGYGRMGVRHVATLQRMGHVIAWVVEDFPASVEQARALLGSSVPVVGSGELDRLLSSAERPSDAVVIATPTSTHKDLTLRSLRAGKAVFCEKPLSTNPDDVRACADEADRLGLPLFIGYQRPWHRDFREAVSRARQMGDAAMPLSVRMKTNDSPCPPAWYLRRAEPIFYDFMCHEFHVLCSLLPPGATWESATAACVDFDDPALGVRSALVSIVAVLPSTGARTTCAIELHRNSNSGYDCTLDVMYADRSLELRNRPRHAVTETRLAEHEHAFGAANDRSFFDKFADAYVTEFEEFVRIVRTGDRAAARPHVAVKAMEMAQAAHRAAVEGRTIVNDAAKQPPKSAVELAVVGAGVGLATGRALDRDIFRVCGTVSPLGAPGGALQLPSGASAVYFDASVAAWEGLGDAVLAAVKSGRHVLVDASAASSVAARASDIALCARESGVAVVLACPAVERADVASVRELIKRGALGEVLSVSGRLCVRVDESGTPLSADAHSSAELASCLRTLACASSGTACAAVTSTKRRGLETVDFVAGEASVSVRRIAVIDKEAAAAAQRESCERSQVDGLHVEVLGTIGAVGIDGVSGDVHLAPLHGARVCVHAGGDPTNGGHGVWRRFRTLMSSAAESVRAFEEDVRAHAAVASQLNKDAAN